MDKKSLIGLLLMGALLIGYSILTRPSQEEIERSRRIADSIQQVELRKQIEAEAARLIQDSIIQASPEEQEELDRQRQSNELGQFAEAATGEEQFFVLENQKIKMTLSTKGGRPYSVELKEYQTHDGKPLLLFDGDTTVFNLNFFSQNRSIATQDLYFQPLSETQNLNAEAREQTLVLRLHASDGNFIDYIYTLKPDDLKVDFTIQFNGVEQLIGKNNPMIDLNWSIALRQQEKGYKWEDQYSTIYYKYFEDEVGKINPRKGGGGSADLTTRVEWIAFKQQFFSTVLLAEKSFLSARVSTTKLPEESNHLKTCTSVMSIPVGGPDGDRVNMTFFFVPNHFKTLKALGHEMEDLVDLGWPFISWINKWFVINIFNFFEKYIANYGIIIIILTIIFKLIVFPLSYKSYLSGAKMRVLKPQVDELTKKFSADKAMEKQQATMALYRKAGVNPMGGCLPALLQMPIWLALFRFFPSSIELRQQSFLWATDLSAYDSILNLPFTIPAYGDHVSLFTLLMAISMMVTTKINMDQTSTAQPMPGMKVMMYIMPVMMLVWFNSYASGLSLYYFFSNVFSYIQQVVTKRLVNEDKLLHKLKENQKKPVKKSGFQARLEKMAKEQQAKQRR